MGRQSFAMKLEIAALPSVISSPAENYLVAKPVFYTCKIVLVKKYVQLQLGQTFYIPWFTTIFFKDQMLGVGIKIKIKCLKTKI